MVKADSMVKEVQSIEDHNRSKGRRKNKEGNFRLKKGRIRGGKEHSYSNGGRGKKNKRNIGFRGQVPVTQKHELGTSGGASLKNAKVLESSKSHGLLTGQRSIVRKKVDPETASYFYKIANFFESNEVDLDERSVICGNALEEARGKELELATDVIISRTLQALLEGCELDQVCSFILSCSRAFGHIATDKSGSHVVETAFRCLASHVQDPEARPIIEDTLKKISQAAAVDSVSMMSSPYGSHVLRRLICLCKGVNMDLDEHHDTRSSLAERLNIFSHSNRKNLQVQQHGFPDIFKFLVVEILDHSKDEIATLWVNKYSSFVIQTMLKLLLGDNQGLVHAILVLLSFTKENTSEGCLIDNDKVHDIFDLLENTASSHLFEVILEVAPENLYDEILMKLFRGSLHKISTNHCGNFVVQALVASAKSQHQVNLIWEELHPHLCHLLELGKSGVVASLLAACQRLQNHEDECCRIIADAVCSESESPDSIVPHILFLDNYFSCGEKSNWQWPVGEKMHTLGCLMLQKIFKYPRKCIQPYIRSFLSLDTANVVQTAKDAGGTRVLESFLCSDSSSSQKLKVGAKLRDHFGELSMHPSSSFTVDKCFDVSDLSLKETIASELSAVRLELSKTKHGPYILKKMDVDVLERHPERWRKRQMAKEMAYKEFQATFGSDDKHQEGKIKRHKKKRQEASRDHRTSLLTTSMDLEFPSLKASMAKLGFPEGKQGNKRKSAEAAASGSSKGSVKKVQSTSLDRQSDSGRTLTTNLADLASKEKLNAAEIRSLFMGTTRKTKKKP